MRIEGALLVVLAMVFVVTIEKEESRCDIQLNRRVLY